MYFKHILGGIAGMLAHTGPVVTPTDPAGGARGLPGCRAAEKAEAARADTATGSVETIKGTVLPTPTRATPAPRP